MHISRPILLAFGAGALLGGLTVGVVAQARATAESTATVKTAVLGG